MKNFLLKTSVAILVISSILGGYSQYAHASGEKFIIEQIFRNDASNMGVFFVVDNAGALSGEISVPFSATGLTTESDVRTGAINAIVAWATTNGYSSAVTGDVLSLRPDLATVATTGSYLDLTNLPSAPSFNNAASHSIVTTAAAANGFQLSSTRNTSVFYSVNTTTTATIGGSSDGYVVLEIAATNSTTASDWKEVSRSRNGQSISLAIALQSVQNIGSELMNVVPAGYYARLRSVNVNGTPTYTYVSGQEVQL